MQSLSIDLLQPNKTDVLPFLAGGGVAPLRYARATLAFSSSQEPYIQEYIVGPMGKGNQTQARPLTFLSTRRPDKKLRVYDADVGADSLTSTIMSQAADITKALWNTVRHAQKACKVLRSILTVAVRTSTASLSQRSPLLGWITGGSRPGKVSRAAQLARLIQSPCCRRVSM